MFVLQSREHFCYFYGLFMYFECTFDVVKMNLFWLLFWFEFLSYFVFLCLFLLSLKRLKLLPFLQYVSLWFWFKKCTMYNVHVLQKLQSPSENCKAKLRGLVVDCEWFLLRLILSWTQQYKQRIRRGRWKVNIDYRFCDMHYNVCMSQDTHLQSVTH